MNFDNLVFGSFIFPMSLLRAYIVQISVLNDIWRHSKVFQTNTRTQNLCTLILLIFFIKSPIQHIHTSKMRFFQSKNQHKSEIKKDISKPLLYKLNEVSCNVFYIVSPCSLTPRYMIWVIFMKSEKSHNLPLRSSNFAKKIKVMQKNLLDRLIAIELPLLHSNKYS